MTKLIIKRIIEVIFVEIFLSALAMSLTFFGLLKDIRVSLLISAFILALYIVWTVIRCYRYRIKHTGKKKYFLVNAPFYLALFLSAIVPGFFIPDNAKDSVYSFLFMPFKLFRYATRIWNPFGDGLMSRPLSALLVSVIIAIPVVIIPFVLSSDRKAYIKKVESK